MNKILPTGIFKNTTATFSICAIVVSAAAQPVLSTTIFPNERLTPVRMISSAKSSGVVLDTVACIFRAVVPNHQPAVLWQSGYIILENKQLKVNHALHPVTNAAMLSGSFQNQFLSSDRKKAVGNKVLQVVLL